LKKALTLFVLALAAMAMMTSFALAGDSCSADKTNAKAASADGKTCTADKAVSGKVCTAEEIAACAKATGVSAEECAKACAEGKLIKHTISIKGMTCESCENSVKTALTKIEGVKHVMSVSHKAETAVVCIDPTVCKTESLVKAVTAKGYQAQMVNAVAKTSDVKEASSKSCSKTCTAAEKAACDAKKKDSKEGDKGEKGDI